ncbi:MAG: outer membrane chaperone Skp [Confluentimicrobium sp.]|nr:outer membrane chaperone Skp [Actibacterium sp.]
MRHFGVCPRRPVHRLIRRLAGAGAALSLCAGGAWAQGDGLSLGTVVQNGGAAGQDQIARPSATPLLTVDQERLFADSAFGRRVARELEQAGNELATENRSIEEELTSEEQSLTQRRGAMQPAQFRKLADTFDEKVTALRRQQDSKTRALTRRRDLERQLFYSSAVPILGELLAEMGAVAILNERAVFIAADSVDVTDEAIARINDRIGAGSGVGRLLPEEPAQDSDGLGPMSDPTEAGDGLLSPGLPDEFPVDDSDTGTDTTPAPLPDGQ